MDCNYCKVDIDSVEFVLNDKVYCSAECIYEEHERKKLK
jgi:hypothetical protein